jgi:hypothetical protein
MAQNNLRIIYDNDIDSATLTVSPAAAAGLPVTNLQKDQKGLVWRSTSTTATLTATWTTAQIFNSVVLPFCNLTPTATIRVRVYTNTTDIVDTATPVRDSGTVNARAYVPGDIWGGAPSTSVNAYSFGGGSYARCWFAAATGRKIVITLVDTSNTSGYLEASRLVCGEYWSPTYNTNFGVSIGYADTSTQTRTEAGNLVSVIKPIHRTLNFDLQWLTDADRVRMLSILRGNGLRKPLFASVFPEDGDPIKEQNYQLYGKITGLNPVTHPLYTIYSSSLTLEEI